MISRVRHSRSLLLQDTFSLVSRMLCSSVFFLLLSILWTMGSGKFQASVLPFLHQEPSSCTGLSSVSIESGNSRLTSGVTEWLLGCLGPLTMALIFCYWIKRKRGRQSDDPLRSPPRPVLQESSYINSRDPRQLQSVYENVNVVSGDEIYSLVYHTQQEVEPAAAQHVRTHGTSEVFSEIYSKSRKINTTYMDYENTM